jgi:glycosyltransferase involved in cell wall biosynthesis
MAPPPERPPLLLAVAGFPPTITGSSILNRNLWGEWPAEDLEVVSFRLPGGRTDPGLALPGVNVHLVEPWPFRPPRLAAQLDPLAAPAVARTLARVSSRRKPRAIWASWPTTAFAVGAWKAARTLGVPLLLHLHDTWQEAYQSRPLYLERLAAWRYEPRVLRESARVFTITDSARDHYRRKLGVDSYVLPHAVPAADLARPDRPLERPAGSERRAHFAGNVYRAMNADALARVCAALEQCREKVVLDCYSPNGAPALARLGISGPRVRVRFGSREDVIAAQTEADIMVLPLAFQSSNPVEIETVFPTKLLEYFVSGRPILVHAPERSWASRDARANGWGDVVDVPDAAAVARAIDRLLADAKHAEALVAAARREARRRAAPEVVSLLRAELQRLGC